ncbi:MAG TPA: MFS transporter [Thermoanaerobaculia bacterium]|nr:MFS transporter [Thermoanaerobaculia bacterium]
MRQTFKAFTYTDFRRLWVGAFTSSTGTWMQEVAQNWLILTMTGSAFLLGLDAFLADAPFLLFSLFGGVLADRLDRRRILLGSQYIQMSSALLLAALVVAGGVRVWMILTLSFVVGLVQSFGGPAYQALVPTLVDREDLPNAVALNSIQFNLARVIGPVLAGVAFYRLGAAACFGLNALSFLAPIAALLTLRRGGGTAQTAEPMLQSLRTGLRAVQETKALRGLVALSFVGSFCALPLVTFLPIFAKDVFHRDAKGYSFLLAAFGVGAIAGAIGVAGFGHVARKGVVAIAMQMTFGALAVGFALSRSPLLSYAFLALAGAALMVVFALFMTLVQTSVDDRLRGRVVSVYSLAFRGAMPLGNLAAGFFASIFSAPAVLVANGAVLICVGAAVLLRSRGGVTSL